MDRTVVRLASIGVLLLLLSPLPALGGCPETLGEVSAPGASVPLEISREADGSLVVEFEDISGALGFNLYRGRIDSFYDHDVAGLNVCAIATSVPLPGRRRAILPADAEADSYFLVTAIYPAGEGTAGFDSRRDEIPVIKNVCFPDELTRDLVLTRIGEYRSGATFATGGAEVVQVRSFDDGVSHLHAWIVNGAESAIDIVSFDDPANPVRLKQVDLSTVEGQPTAGPTSVAIDPQGRGVAVSIPAATVQQPGWVQLLNLNGDVVDTVAVGALPDMLTFSPDGSLILVANEGEPSDSYAVDPEGSVTLVEIDVGFSVSGTTTIGFAGVPSSGDVRTIGPNASDSTLDYEPEYVVIEPSGDVAWVVLQENNAIAELDLVTRTFVEVRGLGVRDHSVDGGGLDPSDRDSGIAIASWPVSGFYQPDGAAFLEVRGQRLLVTANEGDARSYGGFDEVARVGDLTLESPLTNNLRNDAKLGRLKVTTTRGDCDENGKFEALFTFGTRSISIFDPRDPSTPVWDSADALEQMTAVALPNDFNSDSDNNTSFDGRSDDKGPEPEGIVVGTVCGRKYAFVGLERVSGVAVFAVGDPENSVPAGYFTSRDFGLPADDAEAGGIGPEGLAFVAAEASPTGQPLLLVANEVSGTVDVWEIVPAYP